MSGIFISYRRQDSPGFAGRLADDLTESYGAEHVFRDVEIVPGQDFTAEIYRAISECDVLLALIGPRWVNAQDRRGELRLLDPNDWVRLEIEAALHRGVAVLPVLVGGASMPADAALPASLATLTRVQALVMTDRCWEQDFVDLERLVARHAPHLSRPADSHAQETAKHYVRRWLPALGRGALWTIKRSVVLVLLVALAYFMLENYADPKVKSFVYRFVDFLRQTVQQATRQVLG